MSKPLLLQILSSLESEALSFIKSKGFITEDIVSREFTDTGIIFTLNYLDSGENSYISYAKDNNNDIHIVVTESDKINEIIFKSNGVVLFDGIETDIFNFTYAPVPASTYASYMCDEDQLPGTCDRTFEVNVGTVTPISLALPVVVKNCTISALAAIIVGNLNWIDPRGLAEVVAGALIALAWDVKTILYCASITRDDSQAPLQYFYKYTETWSGSGESWPHKSYKVENLL